MWLAFTCLFGHLYCGAGRPGHERTIAVDARPESVEDEGGRAPACLKQGRYGQKQFWQHSYFCNLVFPAPAQPAGRSALLVNQLISLVN